MIGQVKLRKQIDDLINQNNFPHTYLLTGMQGQGKRTMANYIADNLKATNYLIEANAENIKQLVIDANNTIAKMHYTIVNIDESLPITQNALLKLIEEPPENATFCMTCCSEMNIMPTIKSRSAVFNLQPYSQNELQEFCKKNNISLNTEICDTMQDILLLNKYDYNRFDVFIQKLYNSVNKFDYKNITPIMNYVSIKAKDNGFDLKLILKMFIKHSIKNKNLNYVKISNQYLNDCLYNNNQEMLFINWLFDLKGV